MMLLGCLQITQDLREYARNHQLEEGEAIKVGRHLIVRLILASPLS